MACREGTPALSGVGRWVAYPVVLWMVSFGASLAGGSRADPHTKASP
jgi:hypothetical protein